MKPHYLIRPRQGLRRLLQTVRRDPGEVTVRLPWGMPLTIDTSEAIGRAIWRHGVYDLPLSDAGANLGYTTALMASRCGPSGRVLAFEPHAGVFERLQRNVERWRGDRVIEAIGAGAEQDSAHAALIGVYTAAVAELHACLTLFRAPAG